MCSILLTTYVRRTLRSTRGTQSVSKVLYLTDNCTQTSKTRQLRSKVNRLTEICALQPEVASRLVTHACVQIHSASVCRQPYSSRCTAQLYSEHLPANVLLMYGLFLAQAACLLTRQGIMITNKRTGHHGNSLAASVEPGRSCCTNV
jgi:hypothetical protein